ncbi:MAG: RNA 2',3'-cyclic phosphodiesterase, partial [Candidatus Firestonebacteria bacterium]|nr:RNA 2',3'-cyclic phosphodiesterase [Candidatus Firestonebacteria bacterium]
AITEFQVREVIAAGQRAAAETPVFSFRLGEPGVFPEQGAARVVWLGLSQGAQGMQALQVNLAGRLRAAGLTLEARAFTPHLTLGRVKSGADTVRGSWLANSGTGTSWKKLEAVAGEIRVMQSHLQPGGARHTLLAACPLNGKLT